MQAPKVSVVIPCYNRERYIGEAVDSILRQGFADFEIVVVDDGSSDRSVDIVSAYDDPRVRLERNPRNLGISPTRNRGIDLARGEYLAILDSDEIAEPQRLERQVRFLDANPDCAIVGSWAVEVNDDNQATGKIKRRPTSSGALDFWLLFRCAVLQYTMMGRTALFREYRYDETMQICDDHDLLLRMHPQHGFANLPEPLVRHRVHAAQTTQAKAARIVEEQHLIVGRRLGALGIAHDADDLTRHFDLAHLRSRNISPDAGYLDWAEAWLRGLSEALEKDKPAARGREVRRAAGELWLTACWRARRHMGASAALRRFAASPLASSLPRSVARRLFIHLPKPIR